MTQNSLTLLDLLCRVTVHRGYRVAEGCKHRLEVFKKKLSIISLFPLPSTRIWFCSLELVPVSNTHRLSLSLSQPGWFTCGCFWIKGLKSPPYFRFEECIFCLIWSSPLPSCFQTFFTMSHRYLMNPIRFWLLFWGRKNYPLEVLISFFDGCWGSPKN